MADHVQGDPPFKRGMTTRLSELRRMHDRAERGARMTADMGAGGESRKGTSGLFFKADQDVGGFWARVTGPYGAGGLLPVYSLAEQVAYAPASPSVVPLQDMPGGRVADAQDANPFGGNWPAYEVNGSLNVPAGRIVRAYFHGACQNPALGTQTPCWTFRDDATPATDPCGLTVTGNNGVTVTGVRAVQFAGQPVTRGGSDSCGDTAVVGFPLIPEIEGPPCPPATPPGPGETNVLLCGGGLWVYSAVTQMWCESPLVNCQAVQSGSGSPGSGSGQPCSTCAACPGGVPGVISFTGHGFVSGSGAGATGRKLAAAGLNITSAGQPLIFSGVSIEPGETLLIVVAAIGFAASPAPLSATFDGVTAPQLTSAFYAPGQMAAAVFALTNTSGATLTGVVQASCSAAVSSGELAATLTAVAGLGDSPTVFGTVQDSGVGGAMTAGTLAGVPAGSWVLGGLFAFGGPPTLSPPLTSAIADAGAGSYGLSTAGDGPTASGDVAVAGGAAIGQWLGLGVALEGSAPAAGCPDCARLNSLWEMTYEDPCVWAAYGDFCGSNGTVVWTFEQNAKGAWELILWAQGVASEIYTSPVDGSGNPTLTWDCRSSLDMVLAGGSHTACASWPGSITVNPQLGYIIPPCGGGGSGGGGGTIPTVCCGSTLLPATLYAHFSGATGNCTCLNGLVLPIVYDGIGDWTATVNPCLGGGTSGLVFSCQSGSGLWRCYIGPLHPSDVSSGCSPLMPTFAYTVPSGMTLCGGAGTFNVTVLTTP